ncbi:GNAT family N-acetyltransferase [Streptomyces sp. NPDC015661]|uniref:GNAT family N-acetyltransferase n=1 Tax=Streptomyces sp. NPDC015661 TaxID=3364961 RepID=UPI0036FAC3AE
MTWQGTIAIERMDGSVTEQAVEAFRLIYAEAFAEPPYNETEDGVAAAFRRFPSQVAKPAFRAVLARTEDGEPVGMAYGHPLAPDTGWWDELAEPVAEDMRREDGHRTFGLMELAVRAAWRGHGVAARLHEALLDGIAAERVLLNVHPGGTAASAAYRAWGYRRIGETRPWGTGEDRYDAMLLDLRRQEPMNAVGTAGGVDRRPNRP